jgi:hypothetical protein
MIIMVTQILEELRIKRFTMICRLPVVTKFLSRTSFQTTRDVILV